MPLPIRIFAGEFQSSLREGRGKSIGLRRTDFAPKKQMILGAIAQQTRFLAAYRPDTSQDAQDAGKTVAAAERMECVRLAGLPRHSAKRDGWRFRSHPGRSTAPKTFGALQALREVRGAQG